MGRVRIFSWDFHMFVYRPVLVTILQQSIFKWAKAMIISATNLFQCFCMPHLSIFTILNLDFSWFSIHEMEYSESAVRSSNCILHYRRVKKTKMIFCLIQAIARIHFNKNVMKTMNIIQFRIHIQHRSVTSHDWCSHNSKNNIKNWNEK